MMTKLKMLFKIAKDHETDLIISMDMNYQIYVSFKDGFIKDGPVLTDIPGRGESAEEAAIDYFDKIYGKEIVFHPNDKDRRRSVYVV